jgi:SnoaL-like domain
VTGVGLPEPAGADLLARQSIRTALQDYCRGVDRIDRELALSAFGPGATVDFVDIFTGTAEEWIDTVLPAHLTFDSTSHQVTNTTAVFSGDGAASEAYVTARIRTPRGVDMAVAGRYLDRWSCRDGRWTIDHRQYVNDVHSEHEVVVGMDETVARRDRDDPSYALFAAGGNPPLLDEQAIREVLQDYCRGVDRVDPALIRSCFHPGATIDFPGIWAGPADEWADVACQGHLAYASQAHQLTNVTVAVDGDTAASEGYVLARVRSYPDESGRRVDMVISGRYLDRLSKRYGRWAIDHRTFASDMHSVYEVVDGLEPSGRRDPSDAGYALLGADPRPATSATAEELRDKQAIRDVLQNYCRAIDRFDRDLARTLWSAGATVDYIGTFQGTGEGFMDWIWETHPGFDATSHQITNVTVALKGDKAASEGAVTVRVRRQDGRDLWASGRYLDRWSRRDGVWAIDERVYVRDVYSLYAVVGGMDTVGRRDAGDPAYALLGAAVA